MNITSFKTLFIQVGKSIESSRDHLESNRLESIRKNELDQIEQNDLNRAVKRLDSKHFSTWIKSHN